MLNGYLKYVLVRLLPYQRIGKSLDGDYPSADMDFIRHEGEGLLRFSPYNTCLENKSDKPSKYSLIFNIPFVQFPLNQYNTHVSSKDFMRIRNPLDQILEEKKDG
jgi:hypothetical protein